MYHNVGERPRDHPLNSDGGIGARWTDGGKKWGGEEEGMGGTGELKRTNGAKKDARMIYIVCR